MTTAEPDMGRAQGGGHFEVLEHDECLQLLREAGIGRVAFTGRDGLTVLPLAFLVDGDRVVLRTADGTQLAGLPDGTQVAFEVDEYDQECTNGWSVLVRGAITHLERDDLSSGLEPPRPFVPGPRRVLLGIDEQQVSGRAVSAD